METATVTYEDLEPGMVILDLWGCPAYTVVAADDPEGRAVQVSDYDTGQALTIEQIPANTAPTYRIIS